VEGQAVAHGKKMTPQPSRDEPYELPEGWVWAAIADLVVDAQPGFACGKKGIEGGIRHLRMNNIGPDCRLNLSQVTRVPSHLARERHLLKPGDVLFCHTNSQKLVGKTALFDIQDGSYAYSNHLTRLRLPSNGPPPRWLSYILATLWRDRYFETRCKQWVNQATVERATLLSTPIPVGPLKEQQRVVAKIEGLFQQSRTAREGLDRIPPLLKKFRQSVLAAAFRGDLTRDWREQNPDIEPASVLLEHIRAERRRKWEDTLRAKGKDPRKAKYKEPAPVDHNGLENLPEGWEYTTVSEVGSLNDDPVLTGPFGAQLPSKEFVLEGVPVIAIGNVMWGNLRLEKVDHVTPEKALELSRYTLQPGDVLFTRSGTVGRSTVIPEYGKGWLMSYHLLRVRVEKSVCDPAYLYFVFRGLLTIQDQITETARGATRPGFNTLLLKQLRLPLPPVQEQQRVVLRIEELFACADAIEAAVKAAYRHAGRLEQSILTRAFRGGLVPQDPNDEPASVLLARIRTEREKGGDAKRRMIDGRREKKRQGAKGMANV